MYLSYENGKVFTTVEPVSLATNSCNGSTTGRSDSNGSSHNCNESRAGSSEDGTTDGTNDESESHNGSTTFSEIDENHTR